MFLRKYDTISIPVPYGTVCADPATVYSRIRINSIRVHILLFVTIVFPLL